MIRVIATALVATLCAGHPAVAQTEIARNDRLTNWALFEDDGYCWMATNTRLPGRDRLLLTVDLEGSVALFLDFEGAAAFDHDADHLMQLGARTVIFRSRGEWAWTMRKSPERLLEDILASQRIGYEMYLTGHGDNNVLKGTWETDEAQQAFDTLRESCGS